MRRLALPLLLCGVLSAPAAAHVNPLLATFATCAGRLSALREHQWLFDGPASEHTSAQRAAVLDLIDAIALGEQNRAALHMRIDAKHAHAALLTRATFNNDPEDAAWARRHAQALTQACTALLLN